MITPRPSGVVAVACLVLLDSNGCVLVSKRAANKHLCGLWEFPGGKVEFGETPESALRREIVEELDYNLGDLTPLTPVQHTYPFATIQLYPFLAQCAQRPTLLLSDHSEVRWIYPQEGHDLQWAEADLPVLSELVQLTGHYTMETGE